MFDLVHGICKYLFRHIVRNLHSNSLINGRRNKIVINSYKGDKHNVHFIPYSRQPLQQNTKEVTRLQ